MANKKSQPMAASRDARWFIWTIVFLISSGALLITYITYVSYTDESLNYTGWAVTGRAIAAQAPNHK